MNTLIVDQIKMYFNFLSGDTDAIFTCCFLDADSKNVIPGYGTFFGKAQEIIELTEKLVASYGATLHTTVNQCKLSGRKTKDIECARCLVVDIDEVTSAERVKEIVQQYQVHMACESSPGKYHLYWKVSPTISLDTWSKYQLALAHMFNGDKNFSQITKTIRVPGVPRRIKSGEVFVPQIKYLEEKLELVHEAILKLFPDINSYYDQALTQNKKERSLLRQAFKSGDLNSALKQTNGKRNTALYYQVKEFVVVSDEANIESAFEYGNALNAGFSVELGGPLDAVEVNNVVNSAFTRGMEAREKRMEKVEKAKELLGYVNGETVIYTDSNGERPKMAIEEHPVEAKSKDKFTETGVTEKVLKDYKEKLTFLGKNLYAFNVDEKLWDIQSVTLCRELHTFASDTIDALLQDPDFIKEMCTNESGEVSMSKLARAKERMRRFNLIFGVTRMLLTSPKIQKSNPATFDALTDSVYMRNGLVNLLTGEIRDVKAEDKLLCRGEVLYDPEAKCDWWLGFLGEVFAENINPQEMVNFMQELFGYSLSGSISAQKIFCHLGDGCNGKSKVLKALDKLLGSYAASIEPDSVVTTKGQFAPRFERLGAKIEGKRVAIIDDMEVKSEWNEGFIKNLTSDKIRARAEYEKSRESPNRCKFHFGLNIAPKPQAENNGILRRLCVIPYQRKFSHDSGTSDLIDSKIQEELPGIFNWSMEGYRRFVSNKGISYPEETELAVEEYKEEHFFIDTALGEMYELSEKETEFIWLSDILVEVKQYLERQGKSSLDLNPTKLGMLIKQKFNVIAIKKWNNEKKNSSRICNLKRKFEIVNPNSML